jgi:hypothetical protein
MKHLINILAAVTITASMLAQSPDKISYQAVVRNSNGELATNQTIGMQVLIIQGKTLGGTVYRENHTPVTNANGLVTIEIGGGDITFGNLSTLDWLNGPYFIRTDIDLNGGTNYTITGTSQILSVPYALNAKTAETMEGGLLWNSREDDIYHNSGRVGIGNNNPLSAMHVSGKAIFDDGYKIYIGDNRIFFEDNGEIASYDQKHKILFRRNENIMEFREYGKIVFSAGATEGTSTNNIIIREDGHIELKNKNIRNIANPVNPQDAATKSYVGAFKEDVFEKLSPSPIVEFSGNFTEDFNTVRWRNAWGIPPNWEDEITPDCEIVPYGFYGTNSLKVSYPAGGVGPKQSGAQFPIVFKKMEWMPASYYNELYMRYYLKFEEGFDFRLGGKLPGLMGGGESWSRSGGNQPDGSNGWTLRFMWRENGKIVIYAYVPESENGKWGGTTSGQDIDCDFTAKPGNWHTIVQYVNVGTPGKDDGKLIVWIDGETKITINDMRFWNTENDYGRIGGIYFSTFHGGKDAEWAPLKNSYAQFADFGVFKVR